MLHVPDVDFENICCHFRMKHLHDDQIFMKSGNTQLLCIDNDKEFSHSTNRINVLIFCLVSNHLPLKVFLKVLILFRTDPAIFQMSYLKMF